MIVSGRVHIPVAATYPISSVKQAVAHAQRGGKIAAVGGFIASIANCCGSASAGRAERPPADMTIRSLQVKLEGGARTRSPTFSTPRPYSQHLADPFIADDGWKRGRNA